MGGLATEAASASTPTEAMQQTDSPDYVAQDSEPAPAQSGGSVESHLDSFFAGSGWTRRDVELVLQLASTAILLYWAFREVA